MLKPEALEQVLGFQGTIITDCAEPNARGRQRARFHSLFNVLPEFIGLENDTPWQNGVEAAGQIVDALDGAKTSGMFPSKPIIILGNVAPRGDDVKEKWENGTPFCYFSTDGGDLVLCTYEGPALSLVRDLGVIDEVELLDVPTSTAIWVEEGIISPREANRINKTQFRSLKYLSKAAFWLAGNRDLPSETRSLVDRPNIDGLVWGIDIFNNAKTTLRPEQIDFEEGNTIEIAGQEATCYELLEDVPTGKLAVTVGSSGYKNSRFLEIVIGRGRAADKLGLNIGSRVIDLSEIKTEKIAV